VTRLSIVTPTTMTAAPPQATSVKALVDHLLDEHRDGEPSDGHQHGEQHREAQALAQLGAVGEAPSQHGHGPVPFLVLPEGLLLLTGQLPLERSGVVERRAPLEGDELVVGVGGAGAGHRSTPSA
jgi:hypothetical protein